MEQVINSEKVSREGGLLEKAASLDTSESVILHGLKILERHYQIPMKAWKMDTLVV